MTYDQELLEQFAAEINAGTIAVANSSEEYFNNLASFFPVCGSKVDWSKVPNAVGIKVRPQEYKEDGLRFFHEIQRVYHLSGKCIIISDGGFDYTLIVQTDALRPILELILDIPHHHYVVAIDYSWCVAFTTEGFIDFGYRPAK